MTAICFTVPGKPQGKARARTYYNAKKKAMSSTTPDKTVLYENFIATAGYKEKLFRQCCESWELKPEYMHIHINSGGHYSQMQEPGGFHYRKYRLMQDTLNLILPCCTSQ